MQKKRFRLVCAVHLFLVRDKTILLARRFNTGYEDGKYSVPAGHIDGNEQVTEAMIREAKEEIDIDIKPNDLHIVHAMHRKSDDERIDFFFEVKQWKGKPKIMERDKCDDLRWFPIHELPHNAISYVKSAMRHYRNNIFFSEFGWN